MAEEDFPGTETGIGAGDAWHEVVAQLDKLGDAIGRWARAAVNDPSYREHLAEAKDAVGKIAASLGDAVEDAAKTEVGLHIAEAASKTGEALKAAGEKVTEEVGPRIASAFGAAADRIHDAAARMEDAASRAGDDAPADEPAASDEAQPPAE